MMIRCGPLLVVFVDADDIAGNPKRAAANISIGSAAMAMEPWRKAGFRCSQRVHYPPDQEPSAHPPRFSFPCLASRTGMSHPLPGST